MILDGKKLSLDILRKLDGSGKSLGIILVGERADSIMYTNMKKKKGEAIGLQVDLLKFDEDVNEDELVSEIKRLSHDGIIVQLPLPSGFDVSKVLEAIDVNKDVDGLSTVSLGKLAKGEAGFVPATPKGVMRLLNSYDVDLKGKDVVIVNHSAIVGKPLALLMLNQGATVTVCHEFTKDLSRHLINADVIVSGVGKRDFIDASMLKERVVLVDVGIVKDEQGLCGDFSKDCYVKADAYTPVPGGVGPMTVAMLLENVVNGR
tara:strand:- start:36351 stop:37133 length:783 start_codon:yes stop_codon:yes gene_type:complete